MRILSIGSDQKLFDENSEVRQRVVEYGKLIDELHVIVFSKRNDNSTLIYDRGYVLISKNVYIYPTNSRTRWFYVFDAYKIAKAIFKSQITNSKSQIPNSKPINLITAQDSFECGLAGWLIKRNFNIPLQLQIHTDFLSFYFWKETFLNKIRVLLAKFLISRADCIRVVSQRIKKSIISSLDFQASRIKVLPIFVDVKKIQEAPVKTDLRKKYPQFDFIILMASRLAREKNIGLAIGATAEIVKKYPKTGLVIVGEGPEGKKIKSLPRRQAGQIFSNIIFEPWTDDIISYYKTSDLFLLTSNYEGYGMAIIEAMAGGCSIVMTDVGLAGEVLINKKEGIVVPVGDKEKLIEAISNLIKNPDLRNSLTENAQKTLSFWQEKEEYLKAYRESWKTCQENF